MTCIAWISINCAADRREDRSDFRGARTDGDEIVVNAIDEEVSMENGERSSRRHEIENRDRASPPSFERAPAGAGPFRFGDAARAAAWFETFVAANICGLGFGRGSLLVDGNEALLAAVGAQVVDLEIGIPLRTLFAIDARAVEALLTGSPREYDITRLDGTQAHVLASGVRFGDDHWLVQLIDLTERNAAERAIKHLALHDPTTGVPNRRLLIDRLDHALSRARRDGSIVAVLFCDIDRFKEVNDRCGHRTGDAVLQATALRLGSVLRQYDTVARVGGDEFVVLLERLTDGTDATQLAERVRVAIKEPIELDDRELEVTTSIGIALTVAGSCDADELLRRADDAMYIAKERGRDQVAYDEADLARDDHAGGRTSE